MVKFSAWSVPLAASLLLAACEGSPPSVTKQQTNGDTARMILTADVTAGGYSLAALVAPNSKAKIQHLVLKLFRLDGSTETAATGANGMPITVDLTNTELDSPVTIGQLRASTTYRVRAYAYKAAGTAPQDLISTSDAASYVDVAVASDDRPTMATLRVKLLDVPFSGIASSSGVTVTNGGYSPVGFEDFGIQAAGVLGSLVSTGSLLYDVSYTKPVRVGNRVYLVGGGSATTSVQVTMLQADGSLAAISVANAAMSRPRDLAQAAAIGNYLYIFGGYDPSANQTLDIIERAVINADGSLGAFSNVGTLTGPRQAGGIYLSGNYVYLLGGRANTLTPLSSVERAAINSDGTLGAFELVAGLNMSTSRAAFTTQAVGSRLYCMGGQSGPAGPNTNTIDIATLAADGTIQGFAASATSLTTARGGGPGSAVIGNRVYVFAGFAGGPQNTIESAPIQSDGSLGAFSTVAGITTLGNMWAVSGFIAGNSYYLFGGAGTDSKLIQRFAIQ